MPHYHWHKVEALPTGRYLITGIHNRRVLEVDAAGKTVWQHAIICPAHAIRLRNGNTLVAAGGSYSGRVQEISPGGAVMWEALTPFEPMCVRVCLGLVRLGFEKPRPADFDLSTSVPYRVLGLQSKDAFIRRKSAQALGELGPKAEAAVPALIETLDDGDAQVRKYVRWALEEIGPAALPRLKKAATDRRVHDRVGAVAVLRLANGAAEEVVPLLVAALKDEQTLVRREAAVSLRQIGPAARIAVPELIVALRDKDVPTEPGGWSVSRAAASALQNLGPEAKEAVPALIEALEADDLDLRIGAIVALGFIGPAAKTAVPHLIAVLKKRIKDPEADFYIRQAVIHALGRIGSEAKAAIPVLTELLKDPDERISRAAATALEKIDG